MRETVSGHHYVGSIHRAINVIISDISLRGREDDLLRAGCVPRVDLQGATCTTVLAGPKQAPVRKRIREIAKSYRQILVTARPVRRRRLWADGRSVLR
jgi:hypothetical protein